MNIYQAQEQKNISTGDFVPKLENSDCARSSILKEEETIRYSKVTEDDDGTYTIEFYEFNLLSHENKMVESQELTNKDVNIAGQDQTKTIR